MEVKHNHAAQRQRPDCTNPPFLASTSISLSAISRACAWSCDGCVSAKRVLCGARVCGCIDLCLWGWRVRQRVSARLRVPALAHLFHSCTQKGVVEFDSSVRGLRVKRAVLHHSCVLACTRRVCVQACCVWACELLLADVTPLTVDRQCPALSSRTDQCNCSQRAAMA